MSLWSRLFGDRPIVTRLVVAVAATMTVVLVLAGAFVYWRVEFALNRQLNQDLDAYHAVVIRNLSTGATPPTDTPGQSYQVYDRAGRVVGGDARTRLSDIETVIGVRAGETVRQDVGSMLPPSNRPYRVLTSRVRTPAGSVVVSSAISRRKHDEALRELLAQLVIADLATLVAASLVGYGVARAALRPVERYRRAAERAGDAPVLPVDPSHDDEITRLGHTLNALLARISTANERERQFLADTSHELRSPLSVMRTELEMALRRPRPPDETKAALESLQDQVERLIAVSNALLDLEEVRAGDTLDGEQVDTGVLIADLVGRYQAEAAVLGRRIEARSPGGTAEGPSTDVVVTGNRHWLDLALGNLVSNALRYGDGTVTIAATDTGDRVRLTVSDEGTGFAPDFVGKAFDRFTRAESSRTSRGTGLGLSLVQAVAHAHGGTAAIDGSSVALDLPVS
ncbi:HAMP domain-containing sensor histidine kinase [Marmoricola sp. URHB0036]|uniref:sensor histidine kinase n=1 Tax=Marmoricola sp. URHB0036 TaxID=1298863 RepID=UPI000424BB58|nr:ATP-binding protein [Marmoricola sp. URHB0036]